MPHEIVNLRSVVQGPEPVVNAEILAKGTADASAASLGKTTIYADGADWQAGIYDRSKLKSGNKIAGPAVVMQMDTTTLILPGHSGEVDAVGNILIRPNA